MKDLFGVICPKCNHSAHMHNGGHCNARWRHEQKFNRYHVCKCELSKDDVLLMVIENLENAAQQSVQADGGYCMCNPNEAPYKIGSKLCAVCEKPRR